MVSRSPIALPPRDNGILNRGAWLFGGRLLGAIVAYLTQIAIARWLGKDALGAYVHAFALCILLTNVSMLGLNTAAMRFLNESSEAGSAGTKRGFMRRATTISAAMSLLLVLGGALVVWGTVAPESRVLYWCALAIVPIYVAMRLQGQFAHAFAWFGLWMIPNTVVRPVLLLLVTWVLWSMGMVTAPETVMGLHLLVIAAVLIPQGLLFRRAISQSVPQEPPTYQTRVWIRTALPLLLVSSFGALYPEVNVMVAGSLMGEGDVAVFNAAYRTAFFFGFVLAAVDSAILPGIARQRTAADTAGVQHLLMQAAKIKLLITGVGTVGTVIAGSFVMGWFGDEFRSGYGALVVLTATQFLRAAVGPAAEILGLSGHEGKCVAVYAWGLGFTVVGHIVLTPWCGAIGAALTVMLVTLVTGVILARTVRRELALKVGWLA